jgi:betaine-aldehyde dehydrogenase
MLDTTTISNFIDGVSRSSDGARTDLIDPVTGKKFGDAPISRESDVDAAYSAAAGAFECWSRTTPAQRQVALLRFADAIETHAGELAAAESQNTGKRTDVVLSDEVPQVVDQMRFFAGAARKLDGLSAGEYTEGYTSWVRREPIGVIGQVAPWNYPMMMAVWKIAPAIAAGNTVVLKPSDTTPVTAVMLADIASRHMPRGVFNVVCGDRRTGELVVSHPRAQMVSLTGSVTAGRSVAVAAADSVKRTHLELGGNAPVIVFADSNIESAARGIAAAAFYNAGQDCTAATRILVESSAHDLLVSALAREATAADGSSRNDAAGVVHVPPLNNINQFGRVADLLAHIPEHAVVVAGGKPAGGDGFYVKPTVVTGLHQDDPLVRSEIFGPVVTVQRFETESEALRLANDTEYALASSVWTHNVARALRMSRSLDFGIVWINAHLTTVSEMPHGGFKQSGHGKDLSMYGFEDYTRIKHVMASLEV